MAKTNLRLVAPDSELRTVTLCRRSNRDMGRDREHLTEHEVERLMKVAKGNRHGHRDATMILIGFRHGLRVSELCDLQRSSIAFETGTMHVRRVQKHLGAGVVLRSGLRSRGADRGYFSSVFASTSSMRAMICRE